MSRVAWGLLVAVWLSPALAQNASPATTTEVSLSVGTSLDSALAALNALGHRIVYSSALVTPGMTLRTRPKATRLDALLEEILAPWSLRAVQAENGDWLVVANSAKPPISRTAPAETWSEEPPLETIDVTASRFGLATSGASAVFLDRQGVEQMPHLADDAVRMLKVLPGVSGGDFSSALNIRGGRREEAQLLIDGAEIDAVMAGGQGPPPRVLTIIHTPKDAIDVLNVAEVEKGTQAIERLVRLVDSGS